MMGARDYINEVIEKKRKQRFEEGVEKGIEIGEERGIRLMKDWYARKEQAEARGEDFNEPPAHSIEE